MDKRNSGLDLFRLMCCIGVLNYHVVDDVIVLPAGRQSFLSFCLYYGSGFCIPGFFLLSGYLAAARDSFSMDYAERKIFVCMRKLLGWNLLWTLVHLYRTGKLYDLMYQFIQGAAAKGILPVSWFLFSYCFLMILAYPLFRLQKKYHMFFAAGAVIWLILLAFGMGNNIRLQKDYVFWMHLYIGYFIWGMTLYDILLFFDQKKKLLNIISAAVFVVMSVVYAFYWNTYRGLPDQYYGKWYYTIWMTGLAVFIFTLEIEKTAIKNLLKRFAENTIVVYLGHLPILLYFSAVYPIGKFRTALVYVILLFCGLQFLAEIFRRLPVLRQLV